MFRRFFSAAAFAFFAVGFVLAYRAWQDVKTGHHSQWDTPVVAKAVGAAACFAIGLAGVRERHRPS